MIFTPHRIGKLTLVNRLVRSATAERMASSTGECTEQLVHFYRTLAQGGVGVIITGHAFIRQDGKANPNMTGIDRDELIPGLKKLTAAVHETSARIIAQINHAGRQTQKEITGTQPVAPSAVGVKLSGTVPRELTPAEIEDLIVTYGQAARRAKAAGFDGVQLHGAHGYLISQFISPYVNRRTDHWGGDLERRKRFLLEVYKEVRQQVGTEFPVLIKLNLEEFHPRGLTFEESSQLALELEPLGIDAIELSGGMAETSSRIARTHIDTPQEEAYFRSYAQRLKQMGLQAPLILVGGLRSPEIMENVLRSGEADFVAMSRPLIREPNLPNEWKAGRKERATCISCNLCLKAQDHALRCEQLARSMKS